MRGAIFFLAASLAFEGLASWIQAAEPDKFQLVLVKPGDTLWGIAQKYLKNPQRWDEIIKHNRLPSSDPSVALPGMTLRVPIELIKEELRSGNLIYRLNKVLFRRKETADWKAASDNMDLYRNDSLRTMEASRARVRFQETDLLELEANSMVVLKPIGKDYDLELKRAGTYVGRARIKTATAIVTPKTKDTEYTATVKNDLSTRVDVFKGLASVEAEGQTVDVPAGMGSEVKMGLPPSFPAKIPDLPAFQARVATLKSGLSAPRGGARAPGVGAGSASLSDAEMAPDVRAIKSEVEALSIGEPISGFRVQFSPTKDFAQTAFNKIYEVDEKIKAADILLPKGRYWVRIALVDLLGVEGRYSPPKLFNLSPNSLTLIGSLKNKDQLAQQGVSADVVLQKPASDETVGAPRYQVRGRARAGLSVIINNERMRLDNAGNFSTTITLVTGPNRIRLNLIDEDGNLDSVERTVTYSP